MPTLKPVLKDYTRKDNKKQIFIRVNHRRKTNFVATGYYIEPKYFRDGKAVAHYTLHNKLNKALYLLLSDFESIILDIPNLRKITVTELCTKLRNKNDGDFFKYFDAKITEIKKETTRQGYSAIKSNLKEFKGTLTMNDITPSLIKDFGEYLKLRVSSNTVRAYLFKLKKIAGIQYDIDIRKVKTKREALGIDELKKLFSAVITGREKAAVDFFKLSFYLVGINAKDLLYMPPAKEFICYKRMKIEEKQDIELKIKISKDAQDIINTYAGNKYLLRYLDKDDSFRYYHSVITRFNIHLKKIGEDLKFPFKLTTGLTRHSWATLAKKLGVSDSDIDLALGHNLNSMTGGYISHSQLMERVDKANELVCRELMVGFS